MYMILSANSFDFISTPFLQDLSPYLPAVVPGLKNSLLDPSPEVRAVSARALGAIVKGMGEDCFNDLMPWLLETLTSDVSSVDRSGAAQGKFSYCIFDYMALHTEC